jgi:hypothetical protein
MNERVMDIVDRLRGLYINAVDERVGLLNGSNRYIWHAKDHNSDWFQPPIQEEAAKEIERLREELRQYKIKEECDKYDKELY